MRANPKIFSRWFLIATSFLIFSCSFDFSKVEYKKGLKEKENQKFTEALTHFRNVMVRHPESQEALKSAREASLISMFEIKDYKQAIEFNSFILKNTPDEVERREAQKSIAKIYLENLSDFTAAKREINKLLMLRNSSEDMVHLRFDLARAEFNLHNFSEAEAELQQALKQVENDDKKFELLMFLGNVQFNNKKAEEAILTYERAKTVAPERAKKENVDMNIVVCYEDSENFQKAIEKLESMRATYPDPEFINLKIERMRERKANLPGSKGLRK